MKKSKKKNKSVMRALFGGLKEVTKAAEQASQRGTRKRVVQKRNCSGC